MHDSACDKAAKNLKRPMVSPETPVRNAIVIIKSWISRKYTKQLSKYHLLLALLKELGVRVRTGSIAMLPLLGARPSGQLRRSRCSTEGN